MCVPVIYSLTYILYHRHWKWLGSLLGLPEQKTEVKFVLCCFLGINNESLETAVTEIIKKVMAERDIERALTKVNQFWEEHKFTFERWTAPVAASNSVANTAAGETGGIGSNNPSCRVLNTLAGLGDTLTQVEEDCLIISKALESPSAEFFYEGLTREKETLCNISELLSLWRNVQEDCLVLARVFLQSSKSAFQSTAKSAAEMQLKTNFDTEFKRYAKLMSEVMKKPVIKHCCSNQSRDRKSILLDFKNTFHQQRLVFGNLIHEKQQTLPRLNFVSFHEILVILGGWWGNEVEFQKAAKNLLGRGVSKICVTMMSDNLVIHGLQTQDGDGIELGQKVLLAGTVGDTAAPGSHRDSEKALPTVDKNGDFNSDGSEDRGVGIRSSKPRSSSSSFLGSETLGRIEVSLSELISESQNSVARILANVLKISTSLENYTMKDYLTNVEQISNTEIEVMWTREFSSVLQSATGFKKEYKRLHVVFNNLAQSLAGLIVVDDDMKPSAMTFATATTSNIASTTPWSKIKNLLTLAMEKRQLCRDFLRSMVTTTDDYNWQSLLRTSFDSEGDSGVIVSQGRAKLYYGNEFHSASSVPIVSGVDMKRTYYTVITAIADSCPVLLNGEALAGKSMCFNFLASRLGRFSGKCSGYPLLPTASPSLPSI